MILQMIYALTFLLVSVAIWSRSLTIFIVAVLILTMIAYMYTNRTYGHPPGGSIHNQSQSNRDICDRVYSEWVALDLSPHLDQNVNVIQFYYDLRHWQRLDQTQFKHSLRFASQFLDPSTPVAQQQTAATNAWVALASFNHCREYNQAEHQWKQIVHQQQLIRREQESINASG